MHAGRDLAAPEGTPVVAALSGTVASSGLAGGYGIAVELEHTEPRRRTLYGHLSEIYVKQGQRVRQGEVIGRVGSTASVQGPICISNCADLKLAVGWPWTPGHGPQSPHGAGG